MTLSNYSDSSSDMSLPTSSLSSTPLSDFSSTSLLSSPRPQPKAKRLQKQNRMFKTKSSSSAYKHIPHRLKPPHLVAKRNARERKRVQAVNCAFSRLRKHVPFEPRHRRLSKVKTLRLAIEYIQHLQELIANHDRQISEEYPVQDMYTNFSHHYYHQHEHRHLVINKSSHELLHPCPADINHERRTNLNKPPAIPSDDAIFIHLHNSASNLQVNTDEQCEFSHNCSGKFESSSQHCSSYNSEPVKENASTIHNLPSCFQNNNSVDGVHLRQTPGCLSLADLLPSIRLDNTSSYATAPNEAQEMITYEQQTSHFIPYRHPNTLTPRDMSVCPNLLGSHIETIPSRSLTSVEAFSRSDINNTILSADTISYMQRILRPASSHLSPQVNMSDNRPDYTSQLRMFQMYSSRIKTVTSDCPLAARQHQLINTDQDVRFSQFDQEMAPLNDYRVHQ